MQQLRSKSVKPSSKGLFKTIKSLVKEADMLRKGMLGSKDLGFYVFRTLICIVGKP